MDCPSEENLIRLKLNDQPGVNHLEFDLEKRELKVWHPAEILPQVTQALENLNLGSKWVETKEANPVNKSEDKDQRKLLWTVLAINFLFFILESLFGFISESMGLVADGLDMFADALVYGLSLLAVGATVVRKKQVALAAGIFQVILAILGFLEIVRRFFGQGELPDYKWMIGVSFFALLANAYCLFLLQKTKSKEAHIKASLIFTSNDVLINLGVIFAATLVLWLDSGIPDLVIGALIFVLVMIGAMRILKLAK